jgi:DNA-binding MarR family transcriptional regulator
MDSIEIPISILKDYRLSFSAKILYGILLKMPEITQSQIAELLNINYYYISKLMKQLEQFGYLKIKTEKNSRMIEIVNLQ